MVKKVIQTGTLQNPVGDSLKNAFTKVNDNFTDLYNALGLDTDALNLGAFEFTGSVMTTTDSSAIVIDQAVTVSSDLTVGGDIVASNIKQVISTAGLKQVYFDPATGQLVAVV